jgi:CheY-like chemotaxis protein
MNREPHILVVDDSAIVRKALTRQLEQFVPG